MYSVHSLLSCSGGSARVGLEHSAAIQTACLQVNYCSTWIFPLVHNRYSSIYLLSWSNGELNLDTLGLILYPPERSELLRRFSVIRRPKPWLLCPNRLSILNRSWFHLKKGSYIDSFFPPLSSQILILLLQVFSPIRQCPCHSVSCRSLQNMWS